MSMNPLVFAPSETPPPSTLFVINRGAALYCGKVLTTGKLWGEDVILSSDRYRSQSVARAMTYLEVYSLGHDALMEVVSNFPLAYKRVRRYVPLRTVAYWAVAYICVPLHTMHTVTCRHMPSHAVTYRYLLACRRVRRSAMLMALRRDMILKATVARMADGTPLKGSSGGMGAMLENASAEDASFCKKAVRLDGLDGRVSMASNNGASSKSLCRDAYGSSRNLALSVCNQGSSQSSEQPGDRRISHDLTGFAAAGLAPTPENETQIASRGVAPAVGMPRHPNALTPKGFPLGHAAARSGSVTFSMDGSVGAGERGSEVSAAPTDDQLSELQAAVSAQQRDISSMGADVRHLVQAVGTLQAQISQLLDAASWSTRDSMERDSVDAGGVQILPINSSADSSGHAQAAQAAAGAPRSRI